MSDQMSFLEPTHSSEGSPARTSVWLAAVKDWLENAADFGTSSTVSLLRSLPVGFLSRTSLACYPVTRGATLPLSFQGWQNSGMGGPTGYLTLNTSESHSAAVECSLSDILEVDVHPKYYLSPRACRGILRRAQRRDRELPPRLHRALLDRIGMEEK